MKSQEAWDFAQKYCVADDLYVPVSGSGGGRTSETVLSGWTFSGIEFIMVS